MRVFTTSQGAHRNCGRSPTRLSLWSECQHDEGGAIAGVVATLDSPFPPRLLNHTGPRLVRQQAALDHVEAIAGAEDVQDGAADGDRAVALDAVDVRDDVRTVYDRHA